MKPVHPLSKPEKILFAILCILAVTVISGSILLLVYPTAKKQVLNQREEEKTEDNFLDDTTSLLPEYCNLNEKIPDISFQDESGKKVSIRDFEGRTTILTFWASWCPDCQKELSVMKELLKTAEKYGDINFLLINRLDHKKETKERASQYLTEQGIDLNTYYDDGLSVYKTLGLHNIPTSLFLDEQGIIRAWSPRQITETSVLEGYLKDTIEGSGKVTCDFITGNMMDDKGGIHTSYESSREETERSDVLSESQGGMLEFAVLNNNKQLFDKVFSFITGKMNLYGLTAWKISGDMPADSNALLDDFRILSALISANQVWGGYEEAIKDYTAAIAKYGVNNGQYVDFYDRKYRQYATRFTLCYGDLKTMSELAKRDETLKEPYEKARKLIEEGRISDSFPLYYSWYNFKTREYERDDLNTAEALVTLLHLAEADMLPKESIAWLKKEISGEGIKARYTVEGQPVNGYQYDSTAVYALTAMIAREIGDRDLQGKALKKMEIMRIVNTSYAYHGAFGMTDGTGIIAFDQIMAMLAYEYTR